MNLDFDGVYRDMKIKTNNRTDNIYSHNVFGHTMNRHTCTNCFEIKI